MAASGSPASPTRYRQTLCAAIARPSVNPDTIAAHLTTGSSCVRFSSTTTRFALWLSSRPDRVHFFLATAHGRSVQAHDIVDGQAILLAAVHRASSAVLLPLLRAAIVRIAPIAGPDAAHHRRD